MKHSEKNGSLILSRRYLHDFKSPIKLHGLYNNFKRIPESVFHKSSKILSNTSSNLFDIQHFQSRQYTSRNILSLSERGFWKDRFPDNSKEFEDELVKSPQTIYAGFDPTADSLHIGNLLVIMALLQCQRAGHKTIVLLGGFTATVGDPSGRNSQRPHLPTEEVASNVIRIKQTVLNIFGNHATLFWKNSREKPLQPVVFLNNNDWLKSMTLQKLLSVLELINVRDLLNNAFVKDRLDSPKAALSAKEFMYQICQAYDWLHLFDQHNCNIQVGGSDQLANIKVGHNFVRDARGKSVTGLTVPLLVTPDGQKLGKSVGNSLWLSADRTTYFDFYQYFLRRTDAEVESLLNLFTFMLDSEIESLMQQSKERPEALLAQKKLAEKVTLLVHGEYGLQIARASTAILYQNESTALLDLPPRELLRLFSGNVTYLSLEPGTTVLEASTKAKCFQRDGEAEQIIKQGGFRINQVQVTEPHMVLIPDAHILPGGYSLFKVGKKKFVLVAWHGYAAMESSA